MEDTVPAVKVHGFICRVAPREISPHTSTDTRRASLSFSHSGTYQLLTPRSGGLPMIVVQHPAQPLAAPDCSTITSMGFIRNDQPVAETLMVSLAVIMRDEFVNPFAQ